MSKFEKEVRSLRRLEAEVQSLKHDWLMVDEVCDLKEEKIRTLTKIATGVVKGKLPLSHLKTYLEDQIVTKARTDLSIEAKAILSDYSIMVTGHKDETNLSKYYFINNQPNNRKKQ